MRLPFRALLGHGYQRRVASGDAQWRNQPEGQSNDSAVRSVILLVVFGRPQQDSNLRTRLRRPLLYPLSYGGWRGRLADAALPGRSQATSRKYHRTRDRSAHILAAEPIASRG